MESYFDKIYIMAIILTFSLYFIGMRNSVKNCIQYLISYVVHGIFVFIMQMRITKGLRCNNLILVFILICIISYNIVPKDENNLVIEKKNVNPCEILHLDPNTLDETAFLIRDVPELKCEGLDWVKCYQSKCNVVPEILITYKNIRCTYSDIIYSENLHYYFGPDFTISNNKTYNLINSDHVRVSCVAKSLNYVAKAKWTGYASGLRTLRTPDSPAKKNNQYNVLIFGYQSTSQNGFVRKMPKSYDYLTSVMHGTVLNGYNILDDNNPSAILPMLTGNTPSELIRRHTTNEEKYYDFLPFIFYKLRDNGYRTAYFQDLSRMSSLPDGFKGFRYQPTDHYLKAFYLEEQIGNWYKRIKNVHCLGDTPQFKFMMNITDQFLHLDGMKFIFTFLSDITNDDFNTIRVTDDDFVKLIQSLFVTKVLENTLVIIMGDNNQYAKSDNTFHGKLEERLPLMCILLPEALKRIRPEAQSALQANVEALTTPHDIHATILDVLDMSEHMNKYKEPGANIPRALSLLKPAPMNRTCNEAGIDYSACPCNVWHELPMTHIMYRKAITALIDYINLVTAPARVYCKHRSVSEILWVMQRGSFDGPYEQITRENYHVKIILAPGEAVYEAFMKYVIKVDKFLFDSSDITRTDSLQDERELTCKENLHHYHELKPFCYCERFSLI